MAKRHRRTRGKAKDDGLAGLFEPYVWAWFQKTFGEASPPQVAAWPKIAEGQHTLIFSPTGSGKTLAAFLWCINELFRMGSQGELDDAIHVLYVSPLKALNNDIQKNLVEPLAGIQRIGVDFPVFRIPGLRDIYASVFDHPGGFALFDISLFGLFERLLAGRVAGRINGRVPVLRQKPKSRRSRMEADRQKNHDKSENNPSHNFPPILTPAWRLQAKERPR